MMDTNLRSWFTGMADPGSAPTVTILLASGAPAEASATLRLGLSSVGGAAETARVFRGVVGSPGQAHDFTGSIEPGAELRFGDGSEIAIRHYGLADFEEYNVPTVLTIYDDDDLAEFLRDADRAWHTGAFASYLTHPAATIANLPALGGTTAAAGPRHRLYVDAAGAISTSPWGSNLGAFDDRIDLIVTRWLRANAATPIGDATCLHNVITEPDRTDALLERCYLPRFVAAVHVLRGLPFSTAEPLRVSGFGGRLTIDAPDIVDPVDAPVLVQVGSTYRAIEPVSGVSAALNLDEVRALEAYLVFGEFLPSAAQAIDQLKTSGLAWDWGLATTTSRLVAA